MSVPISDHAAAVEALYRAAASPDLWPDALVVLADQIGAIGGMLTHSAPVGQRSFLVSARLRDDLTGPYLQHYALNPYSLAFARVAPGQAYVANQLVDFASVRRTAFHADILAPQRIGDQVAFIHAGLTRNGGSGGIGFQFAGQQAEAAGRAAVRLSQLAPHLSRAIDLTLLLGRERSGARQIERMLDAMPGAALLLDRKGGVMRTNAAADSLLRQADGIVAINADALRLEASSRAETRALAACIAQALAIARGEERGLDGTLRITRPSGRSPLLVLVTPLPPPSFSLWEAFDGGARAMVQIVDPHTPTQAQAESLRLAAGLTAAEARVAALIGGGASATEAAAALGVSATTVKTHLARIFDKTGLRSQVALARLIASIPAPAERDPEI